ncbi:MAG: hypothetical protein MZV63_42910 [Marinilabiliales bacterium]|nr:hypothetical protein [Marinilabiliales bacterium]
MASGHVEFVRSDWDTSVNDSSDRWKQTVEDAATCGQKYVVTPMAREGIRRNYDDFMTSHGCLQQVRRALQQVGDEVRRVSQPRL